MEAAELKYWVAFQRIPGVGPATMGMLERRFGTMREAWQAGEGALAGARLDRKTVQSVVSRRPGIDPDKEMALLAKHGRAITWHDEEYPPRLKEIHHPPPVLYIQGTLKPEDERSVAVVGTRKATAYGREACRDLTYGLAQSGVTIVSGLARGVDAVAHRAALEARGRTIAVMGSGLDIIYPSEHADLAAEIARNGALVTEHPIGIRPLGEHFPRRNRIMSGMTLGTLVVEAGEGSGALITANLALEQNREVFAVPGNIFSPASSGTNSLIKLSGAKLVSSHADILEELNLFYVGAGPSTSSFDRLRTESGRTDVEVGTEPIRMTAVFPVDAGDAKLLQFVTYDPIHIDEIVRASGMGTSQVSGGLAIMELKGRVRQVGGMHYVRLKGEPAGHQTAR
jgi:DNA processing protein